MRTRACKIVATMGPASDSPDQLRRLFETGVDVVRVNFSHGEASEQAARIKRVHETAASIDRHIAVLADLQGPKIRVGKMSGGGRDLRFGKEIRIVAGKESDEEDVVPMPHAEIVAALEPGDTLKFDDGLMMATVEKADGDARICKIDIPGRLTDKKGVSIPGRALPVTALTEKDIADLEVALEAGADYVALSFVQTAQDVADAKARIKGRARVISKIEKPTAVRDIDAIVDLSDAVMVARGDLGVELPVEQVPIAQRRIIRAARRAGKPVIVATHMLQSMIQEATPTRAEATDIATAVYQGADAVMLSAETAVGRHPLTAVAVMERVIRAIEDDVNQGASHLGAAAPFDQPTNDAQAFGRAVSDLANAAPTVAVVAFTESGATGFTIAQARPQAPLLVVTPRPQSARAMGLVWGADAVVHSDCADVEALLVAADSAARAKGAPAGGRIVLAAGLPIGQPGGTNLIHVFEAGVIRATRKG